LKFLKADFGENQISEIEFLKLTQEDIGDIYHSKMKFSKRHFEGSFDFQKGGYRGERPVKFTTLNNKRFSGFDSKWYNLLYHHLDKLPLMCYNGW